VIFKKYSVYNTLEICTGIFTLTRCRKLEYGDEDKLSAVWTRVRIHQSDSFDRVSPIRDSYCSWFASGRSL